MKKLFILLSIVSGIANAEELTHTESILIEMYRNKEKEVDTAVHDLKATTKTTRQLILDQNTALSASSEKLNQYNNELTATKNALKAQALATKKHKNINVATASAVAGSLVTLLAVYIIKKETSVYSLAESWWKNSTINSWFSKAKEVSSSAAEAASKSAQGANL